MNYTKMKSGLKKGIVGVCILVVTLLFTTPLSAQTNGKSGKGLYCLVLNCRMVLNGQSRIVNLYAMEGILRNPRTIYM